MFVYQMVLMIAIKAVLRLLFEEILHHKSPVQRYHTVVGLVPEAKGPKSEWKCCLQPMNLQSELVLVVYATDLRCGYILW